MAAEQGVVEMSSVAVRLREEIEAGRYAPCFPDCVEGPPTCGCAERYILNLLAVFDAAHDYLDKERRRARTSVATKARLKLQNTLAALHTQASDEGKP